MANNGDGVRADGPGDITLLNCSVINNAGHGYHETVSTVLTAFNTDFAGNILSDGHVDAGGLVNLTCCVIDIDRWGGGGTINETYDGCPPISDEATTWGEIRSLL